MPPIADQSADQTTMEALAAGGNRGPAAGAGAGAGATAGGGDAARAKTEQAVSQIRQYQAQLAELGKAIPGSEKLITQMQKELRQLAVMAAQAGATQNGSADALPS